jgi:hypothetical protein
LKIDLHRAVRLLSLIVFAVACGLAMHRLRRTPEQVDLTRYVEIELPNVFRSEQQIQGRIDRLGRAPGLPPAEARALLVDDVIPRLLRLRKQIEGLAHDTDETTALNAEYLALTDRLIDACRTCVRIIDDPKLPEAEGLAQVRRRFAEVHDAYHVWNEHVRQACRRHRLAPPEGRP